MPRFTPRKHLRHDIPAWVPEGALYFVTICAKPRGADLLVSPTVATALLESVSFRHERGVWFVRLFLIMPDHVHALVAVPPLGSIRSEIRAWKRFTARRLTITWQDGFFEHRLRPEEQFDLKSRYIRENPVRAGLVTQATDWPWVWAPETAVYRE